MDIDQLLESFTFRFTASGVRKPERTAEELLSHVLGCGPKETHQPDPVPAPLSSGQQMAIIRELETFAERIENGESPQEVLGCLDF
jgi:hypothetical protein